MLIELQEKSTSNDLMAFPMTTRNMDHMRYLLRCAGEAGRDGQLLITGSMSHMAPELDISRAIE